MIGPFGHDRADRLRLLWGAAAFLQRREDMRIEAVDSRILCASILRKRWIVGGFAGRNRSGLNPPSPLGISAAMASAGSSCVETEAGRSHH